MLVFKPVTLDSIAEIREFLRLQPYRTCDFSIGGIYMWASYFKYEYAIFEDTLFMKGLSEADASELAFSLPLGALPIKESVEVLREYCRAINRELVLSAVPEDAMQELVTEYACRNYKLEDWTDYLYDGKLLATLPGTLYHKKRNHVSRFRREYPEAVYCRLDSSNLDQTLAFFERYRRQYDKLSPLYRNEMDMTEHVLKNFSLFRFLGAVLLVGDRVAGFTVGEVINDTLYVHIEKADKDFEGVYEALNMKFAEDILATYPEVRYINREEDVGDEGLRKAKLSYHPISLLGKYNLIFNN